MGEILEPFFKRGRKDEPIEISADDILKAIAEGRGIDIADARIKGDMDIRKTRDPRKQRSFWIVPKNRTKDVKIVFSEVCGALEFGYTVFDGMVDFQGTTFQEVAAFGQSDFNEYAHFTDVTFARDASFESSVFNNTAQFSSATFGGNAVFSDTTFNGRALFSFTAFRRYANFESAKFSKLVTFRRADVKHLANFENIDFRENTVFRGMWNEILLPIMPCPLCRVLSILWERVQKRGHKSTDFSKRCSYLYNMSLRMHKWLGKAIVTEFIHLNTATLMDASTNPYLKRYIDDEQWIASWRQRSWWRKVLFFFWELTSHCGRSFGLWLFWSFVLAVIFGFLYKGHIDIGSVKNWYTPFYFSVVTFTTLGFGDVTPIDWLGQLWITLEVVCGYLMLGGLISIFANKFARRS